MGGHGTKQRRKIAEYFNRLNMVQLHERYRRDDRRTGDSIIANVNVSSRSRKRLLTYLLYFTILPQ